MILGSLLSDIFLLMIKCSGSLKTGFSSFFISFITTSPSLLAGTSSADAAAGFASTRALIGVFLALYTLAAAGLGYLGSSLGLLTGVAGLFAPITYCSVSFLADAPSLRFTGRVAYGVVLPSAAAAVLTGSFFGVWATVTLAVWFTVLVP